MLQSLYHRHFLTGGIDYLGNGGLGSHLSVIMEGWDTQAMKAALELTILPLSCAFPNSDKQGKVSKFYRLVGM